MIRSILAVLAGVVLWGTLWVGHSQFLAAVFSGYTAEDGSITGTGFLLWLLVFSVGLDLLAGNVAARIAASRPILHATVLGVIQLAIGIGVQSSAWHLMPVWFHLSFLALVLPCHVLGGVRQAERRPAAVPA